MALLDQKELEVSRPSCHKKAKPLKTITAHTSRKLSCLIQSINADY